MNVQESLARMYMSRIPQTNYQIPTAPAPTAFIEQITRGRVLLNVKPNSRNNKGYSVGTRFANEMWHESWETEGGNYDFDVTSQNLGRHLLAALGGYSVAPVAGQTGAYKHTFTPLDVSVTSQLPSYSFVPQAQVSALAIDSIFPSMNLESLRLSSEGAARVSGSASWIGSGEEVTPSAVDVATHVQLVQGTQNNFYHTQSKVLLSADNNGGAGFSTCELMRWNFGIQNSFAEHPGCPRFIVANDPESGALRSERLLIDTMFDYDFSLKLRASDAAYAALKAQTPTSIVNSLIGKTIGATTAKHQMDITMALTKYESVSRVFNNGFAEVNIKPVALFDNATSSVLKVELVNNIPSFIV